MASASAAISSKPGRFMKSKADGLHLNMQMDDWFKIIAASCDLPADVLRQLRDVGFVIFPGPVASCDMERLAGIHDNAVDSADAADVRVGSTTTRISDFVNRDAEFDELYVYPPLLKACCSVIGRPFKLSTMHARTVRPGMPAQGLHVDFERIDDGWPMVGFIYMIDEFQNENGVTLFVPGSHNWPVKPNDLMKSHLENHEAHVPACGPAGSLIVFNGSIWHGHSANTSANARRSIQGAFIRREERSGADLPARMLPETIARISPLAKYLLTV